ncbi:MAG: solute symporter family protein [Methyloceanibacter sp.]|uniref:solute symporter family protein n=1 Tax=Methyloceanibacter sp. TaxID=1965321 RepID=UPI003D6C8720
MSAPSRQRTPNPHLGAYYGIVTSAFVSLVVVLAMLEQLGWSEGAVARNVILWPVALYLVIAVGTRTLDVEDFFASGRRVPPVYNAFVLAATAVGGIGFFAYTGAIFFLGFDALAIGLGWTSGFLLAGVLFVPYLRKAGAYTLPAFLGQRFRSRPARMAASVLQVPPTALLLAAEIKIAAVAASMFLPLSFSLAVLLVAAFVAAVGILGGMRSLTWTGSAEFIAGAVGLAATLMVVSVLLTNLPAPQFTYSEMFGALQNAETAAGVSPVSPGEIDPAFPATAPTQAAKPFLQPFAAINEPGFVALFLCFTLGTAALPSLLVRSGVTSSVGDQRRSTAWALALVALFAITAPSLAVFAKMLVFRDMALDPTAGLPSWLADLSGWQLMEAADGDGDGVVRAGELLIARDGVALALPMLAELPFVLTALMAAAGLAIALAAAASHLFTLAASLADDVYGVLDRRPIALPRLMAAWAAIAACALAAAVFLFIAEVDALRAAVTAFAFAAATFFPVLLLALWWPRCTAWGALAAMGTGFAILVFFITAGAFGLGETVAGTSAAGLIAAALALGAGVGASLYGPAPSAAEMAYYEEMRKPEGEAIFDRAQKRAATASAAEQ